LTDDLLIDCLSLCSTISYFSLSKRTLTFSSHRASYGWHVIVILKSTTQHLLWDRQLPGAWPFNNRV